MDRRVALWACLALGSLGAVTTGCGDEGRDAGGIAAATTYGKANEEPQAFARRVAKLLETTQSKKDCGQLETQLANSRVRFACPPDRALRRSMARFRVVDAEAYGNGAVVDYRSGASPNGAAIVLAVAPDRNWGIGDFGVVTKPSVGTSDSNSRDDYDKAVNAYLRAVRRRDCNAFSQVAFAALNHAGTNCPRAFDDTKDLTRLLNDNPRITLAYEGGNSTFGFYSFETSNPRGARTISIINGEAIGRPNAMVMGVSPSPTAAYQRAVIKEAREQLREQRRSETSPKPN